MDLMLGDTKFSIKEENIENVIKAFKKTYSKNANIKVEDINSIEDVFWEFGYNVFTDEDGNITDIDNDSSNLPGGQKKFFSSIAKYVERESYIILKTDDSQSKFIFDDGKVKEFKGEVVFCDKNLSYDNVFAILKYILDYACNSYRVREVIRWLIDGDVTEEELISLEFDKDDIKKVKRILRTKKISRFSYDAVI